VQKRNEDWWECIDHSCGQKIQFLMLDGMPNRAKAYMLLRQRYEALLRQAAFHETRKHLANGHRPRQFQQR